MWRGFGYLAGFIALALALAACGGGGSGGGSTSSTADAPIISDLVARALDPELANRNIRYVVAFNFTDRNGDVSGGECEVLLNGTSIGRAPIQPTSGSDPSATQGAVACAFVVRASPTSTVWGAEC